MTGVVGRGLRKTYGATSALDGVDLDVRRGSVHGLLGPNGAGKSTLLRALLGLVRLDAGDIELAGVVAGFVEVPGAYPYLTGRRNLELLTRLDDHPGDVGQALAQVNLTDRADTKVAGWSLGMRQRLAIAAALLGVFLLIESRVSSPLVPLGLFKLRNVATANVVGILWSAAMFAWFFLSALYMQVVLHYDPMKVGLAFLPSNLIMGVLSLGISAKLVMRFGIRTPLAAGLGMAALGLLLFARAPVDGNYLTDVLPSMLLLGLGAGIAFNPILLAAMSDVEPQEAGLASGVVNTAFMMGGALGLAVLASLAASRTETLTAEGESHLEALTGGYHLAFLVGAAFAVAAAAVGAAFLRTQAAAAQTEVEPEPA